MALHPRSPVDDTPLPPVAEADDAAVDAAVAGAARARIAWSALAIEERARLLPALADALEADRDRCAALMVQEMGKPIRAARAEIDKCARLCRHHAAHAARWLAPRPVATEALRSYVAYEPLGVIAAIMPWNFPFWQVFRCAVPALIAGNAVVLKHAENVPRCAIRIEALFREAGFPEGVFRTLLVDRRRVADLLARPEIRGAALTGSVRAGRAVAEVMGRLLKPTVLELGGSDPAIVLDDADVAAAARLCVDARMQNNGQTCIAAKRFIVVEALREAFTRHVVAEMAAIEMRDPMDEACTLGPMARVDLRDALHDQVRRSVAAGARCLLGGVVPDRPGAWYPPTVLDDVHPGMPAWDEELFGPVAAILTARDEDDAVRIANDTPFGLGACVISGDPDRGERLARRIRAGSAFVNRPVASDPRLPFGGVGHSGWGRELGEEGIRAFTCVKTVWVDPPR